MFRTFGASNGGAVPPHTGGGGGGGLLGRGTGVGTLATATAGGGSGGDGRTDPAAAATRRGCAQGAKVVVILREDARVPPGHIAEAAVPEAAGATRLRHRAGLTVLRRSARVRVLSAVESPVASPR